MNAGENAEVLFHESNFAVVQMRGRAYPGVVIQGDSLWSILSEIHEAIKYFESNREESLGCLENARQQLEWRLTEYKKVCEANGIK